MRDDTTTPWSYVLPGALAVMLGVLAADLVRLAVVAAVAKQAMSDFNEQMKEVTRTLPTAAPIYQGNHSSSDDQQVIDTVPRLPGLTTANQQGLREACIAGTVSLRETNGWSQDMSDGMPKRCVAISR